MEGTPTVAEQAHHNYKTDPLPEVQPGYEVYFYTKFEPNEKEIAHVFAPDKLGKKDVRVGWIIPILSIFSIEHDFGEDKYFIKHAHEAIKLIGELSLDERTYIVVLSKRYMSEAGISSASELSLSFLEFGIYPFKSNHSKVRRLAGKDFQKAIHVTKGFDITKAKGFFESLFLDTLQLETNDYARFMLIYQLYEMAMELVFYATIASYKAEKLPLSSIREKFSDLSSERKLINLLYTGMGGSPFLEGLSSEMKAVLGDTKEDKYYDQACVANYIYDIRNSLVHNYYRSGYKKQIQYFTNYLELELIRVIRYLYNTHNFKEEILSTYFSGD
ncbi:MULTISPECIES: hypothetical protein [Pseudomonas putida group]|uniref:hypothetical protein n=1 Tax=Pseudomonas putida group TaxID=136845 RepID=UPI000E6B3C5C|nr:hypothetical protein [Pseudomonas putida]RIZ41602.1 hypothetical protein CIK02_18675 [Pseudomonas putida]